MIAAILERTPAPAHARQVGAVMRVAGPLVVAEGLEAPRLHEVVHVGDLGLVAEVIRLDRGQAVLQVYEDTAGLRIGERVVSTGAPLTVELGPGLLGTIFDGIQRPLTRWAVDGPLLGRGMAMPALDRERQWTFTPAVKVGDVVEPGDVLGTVAETAALTHRVIAPPGRSGRVTAVGQGPLQVTDAAAWLDGDPVLLFHHWPVRRRRPVKRHLDPDRPLVSGQRVIDTLFPVALGGSAAIPGGFGTGKTVLEQTLARWSEADVIVYVACGERGNELTELLEAFRDEIDPRRGTPLMDRTVFVANTSNMPIAAREASIYTGITLAEYYRDQGYDVALLADSTSRWAEALREVSGRLEEMPGEEGYPAYLAARLAGFYERAGAVECLGQSPREGSVTIVSAVSPPGGDFSEPVTQQSLRLAGTFWGLDTDLARRRHFPAIHWTRSYTLYRLTPWFEAEVEESWSEHRDWALALLQEESELLSVVQLLGLETLGPRQRVVLQSGRRVREDFLQQSAFDPVDAFCPLKRQARMLRLLHTAHDAALRAVERGVPPERLETVPALVELARMRGWPCEDVDRRAALIEEQLHDQLAALAEGVPQ